MSSKHNSCIAGEGEGAVSSCRRQHKFVHYKNQTLWCQKGQTNKWTVPGSSMSGGIRGSYSSALFC